MFLCMQGTTLYLTLIKPGINVTKMCMKSQKLDFTSFNKLNSAVKSEQLSKVSQPLTSDRSLCL